MEWNEMRLNKDEDLIEKKKKKSVANKRIYVSIFIIVRKCMHVSFKDVLFFDLFLFVLSLLFFRR